MRTQMLYGLAGLAGALIALLADVIQKELASSVVKISSSLSVVLSLPITPLWTLLILALAGAAYCAFRSKALGEAFTVGLGILSVIMTITPYNPPSTLPAAPAERDAFWHGPWSPALLFAAHPAGMPQPQLVADSATEQPLLMADQALHGVKIRLIVPAQEKLSDRVTLQVFDAKSGNKVGSIATKGTQFNFGLAPGDYDIRVTAPGYQIIDEELTVRGDTGKDVALKKSAVPPSLQRLFVPAR
jgi:hypothetical protein